MNGELFHRIFVFQQCKSDFRDYPIGPMLSGIDSTCIFFFLDTKNKAAPVICKLNFPFRKFFRNCIMLAFMGYNQNLKKKYLVYLQG